MTRHLWKGVLIAAIALIAVFLWPSQESYAYYYNNLEASDEAVSVYVGEKISLAQYASSGQTDNYRLGSGTGTASYDSSSGVVFFTKTGTLYVHDDVRDATGKILETKTWYFVITNAKPQIITQPQNQQGYYQDSVTFSVETRQDPSTLSYQWFIVHSNSIAAYSSDLFDVDDWHSSTLTINNLEFWMNGVRVYCKVTSKNNSDYYVYTFNEPISETPQLTVVKKPIETILYLNGLEKAIAKDPLDYDAVLSESADSNDNYALTKISALTYQRGEETLSAGSRINQGDELTVSFTITLKDRNNYAFPDNFLVSWKDQTIKTEEVNAYTRKVSFTYTVDECNPYYLESVNMFYLDIDASTNVLPCSVTTQNEFCEVESIQWSTEEDNYTVWIDLVALDEYFFDELTMVTINGLSMTQKETSSSDKLVLEYVYPFTADVPLILENPTSAEVYDGETATFHIEAYFAQSYQWYCLEFGSDEPIALTDNDIYSGCNTNTLSVVTNIEQDLFTYYCVVDSTESSSAALKVHVNPNNTPWTPSEEWVDYGWRVLVYVSIALVLTIVGIWYLLRSVYGKWYQKGMKRKK